MKGNLKVCLQKILGFLVLCARSGVKILQYDMGHSVYFNTEA